MTNKLTSSDIYDVNKKTGALILGKNRLEDYATKYLTKYCKEALEKPMPLPVEDILKKLNLTVREVCLSRNLDVFGCCLLLDSDIEIFDRQNKTSRIISYPAGTILIDPDSESAYGEGFKRNTLIHEAVHWEKDKKYFEILAIKNVAASEKLYPIMCRQSEMFYEPPEGKKTKENEVRWLEWQAHRLAPRILMPFEMFRKKALEYVESYKNISVHEDLSCDNLIEDLSTFFNTSRTSVKYRLIETGITDLISEFYDYEAVFSEISGVKQFVPVTAIEAYQLLENCPSLYDWVGVGHFIFADGYFVLADSRYISSDGKEFHLTPRAKKDLSKCVINIQERIYNKYCNSEKDLTGFAVLFKHSGAQQQLLTFHRKNQSNYKYVPEEVYKEFCEKELLYDDNEEIELKKMHGDPKCTLCDCLWFLLKNRNIIYPEKFNEITELHNNYLGKIKNNNYNNMGTAHLMALCVGMKLNVRGIYLLFEKSENRLDYYREPDQTYLRIIETMPGISVQNFNLILREKGFKELGSDIR